MSTASQAKGKRSLFDGTIVRRAAVDALRKLAPQLMMKNPVMFVVEVGSVLTTVLLCLNTFTHHGHFRFDLQITLWLWFTVLFANFAEAMAEGRGKAQADALRLAKSETTAYKVTKSGIEEIASSLLRADDVVRVVAGQMIPGDGEVIEGVASVDESAITGESAPVIREAGGDRSAVTGGTRVLSDQITVRITSNPGETFLDRMIALVEGAERQKTPNEIALNILLAAGSRHPATLRCLLRCSADSLRAHLAARLPYPHHDRRLALGYRHCGNGPSGSAQCACHLRPCRGGRRRREYTAAGQNRYDHYR